MKKFVLLLILTCLAIQAKAQFDKSYQSKKSDIVVVEKQPEPPNGLIGFYNWINNELKYPKKARKKKIQGRVLVQFIVNQEGKLTDAKILKGIEGEWGFEEEVLRIFSLPHLPVWKPGTQNDRPVKVRMTMPILFSL